MSSLPIGREPDISLDGPVFVCPDCHEGTDLNRGDVQVCCPSGHVFPWQDVFAFSVKYWAYTAWQVVTREKERDNG